jgi:hypothetical protein
MNLDRFNPTRRASATGPDRADGRVATGPTARDRDESASTVRDRTAVDDRDRTAVADRDRTAVADRDRTAVADRDRTAVDEPAIDRRTIIAREREAFGGVKIGSAFFGWLTATGTAVLLTAFAAAGGTAVGVLNGDPLSDPDYAVTWRGVRGAIVIVAVLLVAYYCGGYVAGRMARFNGIKQGLAVFGWAVVMALVVAALGAIAGTQWDALNAVTGVPRFNTGPTQITADGALVGVLAVAAALVGSVLGGLGGMRFHRRVDRAGWVSAQRG